MLLLLSILIKGKCISLHNFLKNIQLNSRNADKVLGILEKDLSIFNDIFIKYWYASYFLSSDIFSRAKIYYSRKEFNVALDEILKILQTNSFFWDAWELLISCVHDMNQVIFVSIFGLKIV